MEKQRDKVRRKSDPLVRSPGLGQGKTGNLDLCMGDGGPNTWAITGCLPQSVYINGKLDQKQNSQDLNKLSDMGCWCSTQFDSTHCTTRPDPQNVGF